ncbi:MAG: hypothetical protein O7A09_10925, partial [Proteobacteria bacterium]|nr:hypothetical protein [Pseudomonadota bacterium]
MRLATRLAALPSLAGGALLTVAVGLGALPASAAQDAAVVEMRAEDLAAQGRCGEAIRVIDEAGSAGGGAAGARLLLVRGQCEIRLGRYTEAS